MPNQHNPTIAVAVREVVTPCGTDVLVPDAAKVGHGITSSESTTDGGDRDLPVHRREQSTLCAKPRRLQSHDVARGRSTVERRSRPSTVWKDPHRSY